MAFGKGVYSTADAARMIHMQPATLRRWLLGYDHHGKSESALWRPQYEIEDDGVVMGFRDLIEARVIHALRRRRIGLPTIRICIERARAIIGDERPFSTKDFKTDGKTIFLEIIKGLDEPLLVDLRRRQGVFKRVVAPTLDDLDFGDDGAERWWLIPGKRTIVADPQHSFGQPIVAEHGITTARIAQSVAAEGSIEAVAKLYEIKPRLVRDALAYEDTLTVRKAA